MSGPARALTIFLIKQGVPAEAVLDKDRSPTATPIKIGHVDGTLYTDSTPPRQPSWVSFFGSAAPKVTAALRTASASALLVVPMKNRVFAVSFGYGRYLIDPLNVESSFGLRVTLNSVSSDKIRSIDKKTFESIATHTREQASKDASLSDFGLDVERDILRAVVGTPTDPTLGNRLAGMDALSATASVNLDELPELLQAYLAKSQETDYKKHYPWIDNILEVRDQAKRQKLDSLLVETLRSGAGGTKIWLAIPDLIDWTDVEGFSYSQSKKSTRFPDVHLSTYLSAFAPETISVESLRSHRVFGWHATDDQVFAKWPIYRCLYAEMEVESETYLLNGGEWYRLDGDFVKVVDDAVSAIPMSSLTTPAYKEGEGEGKYNIRLAQSIGGARCLDKQLIRFGGGKSSIEFCDVYSPSREIIHVKRYGGSSVLSHLFAQGTVSATAFIADGRFRQEVNKLLPPALKIKNPVKKPVASDYEIAFLVVSKSAGNLSLPFFSRVTLRNAVMQLTSYGFRATLAKVNVA